MTPRAGALPSLVLLGVPGTAFAHSPIDGINDFYNGLLHPLFVPAHAMLLVALGLYFGQRDLRESRGPLAAFLAAAAAGLLLSSTAGIPSLETLQLAAAVVVGLLVALHVPLPPAGRAALAALGGMAVALDSGPETLVGMPRALALIGTGVGMGLLLLYTMGIADYLGKKSWLRIGVRVAGSWISASAVMVIALSLSGHVS